MGKIENLKPFRKGQSGNPFGVPKGTKHFATIANAILDTITEWEEGEEKIELTRRELMAYRLVKDAVDSDDPAVRVRAVKELLDRIDGKSKQTIDIEAAIDSDVKTSYTLPDGQVIQI